MAIPGAAYLSEKIRDFHQHPDATLDNCSGTTVLSPQGDLNPNRFCFISHLCCCLFLRTQQYHGQTMLPRTSLFFWAAQILQSQGASHASCPSCLQKPWHTRFHTLLLASPTYCSWAPSLSVQVLSLFLPVSHMYWLYNLGWSISFLLKLVLHSCSHTFLYSPLYLSIYALSSTTHQKQAWKPHKSN